MHLFVDISSHGLGHLALSAPVLNALARRQRESGQDLHLCLRSGLPLATLRARIEAPFELIAASSDFGFAMLDSLRVDRAASAAAYRQAHEDWEGRVAREGEFLAALGVDGVFSNVSYLPLAGAARAGIPSLALCCLNWADLFGHFFGFEPWAADIHRQMLAAYQSARLFLRPAPAMPMPAMRRQQAIGTIAAPGRRQPLPLPAHRVVLVALGGFDHRLPMEDWPDIPDICWLVPEKWHCRHPRAVALESLGLPFTDVLASVDAVLTKPGYGTFTEATCSGTPVLYQRREDWPEQDCLIEWLHTHGRAREVSGARLQDGDLAADLEALLALPPVSAVLPTGAEEAAEIIDTLFRTPAT